MWGIESLFREQRKLQPPTPLDVLIKHMTKPAPPSLSVLVDLLYRSDAYGKFIDLINELMPEHYADIIRETSPEKQIISFCEFFHRKYFELDVDDFTMNYEGSEMYEVFVRFMPVYILGMGYDDYDSMAEDGNPEDILLMYLLENPHEGGPNVAFAEAAAKIIPQEIIRRVPEGGFQISTLGVLVNGTKYKALALYGKKLGGITGNYFMDTDYETYNNGYVPEWDKPTVLVLAKQWKQAMRWGDEINKFKIWLKEDFTNHFEELLNFLLKRREEINGILNQNGNKDPGLKIVSEPESTSMGATGQIGSTAG